MDEDVVKFVLLALGALILAYGIIMSLPVHVDVTNPGITVVGVTLGSERDEGQPIDITLEWEAPDVRNCYITTDVRPQGAPMGEPEGAAWSNYHLIRYNLNTGSAMVENWINIEIISQRSRIQTFHYLIAAAGEDVLAFDVYAELHCDDEFINQDVMTASRA